jgi:hypothetical protein
MIFCLPAIFYILFDPQPVVLSRMIESTRSSKRGEKAQLNKFNKIKNSKDPPKL